MDARTAALLAPLADGRYDRLALHLRRGMGDRPGDRRFPGRTEPAGVEVEAHRPYAPGDDLRHLDWNALARLDELLVRRFTAEREVVFHLLVDASGSMGMPDAKLATAIEIATALAYLALASNDAVRPVVLPADGPPRATAVLRGGHRAGGVARAAACFAAARAAGRLAVGDALAAYAAEHARPGAVVVVSDFLLDPGSLQPGIEALRRAGHEVALLHVLAASEIDPAGGFRHAVLRDVESGATRPIALGRAALAAYRAALEEHLAALAALAARSGAAYARITAGESVRDFVTLGLSAAGLVRRR